MEEPWGPPTRLASARASNGRPTIVRPPTAHGARSALEYCGLARAGSPGVARKCLVANRSLSTRSSPRDSQVHLPGTLHCGHGLTDFPVSSLSPRPRPRSATFLSPVVLDARRRFLRLGRHRLLDCPLGLCSGGRSPFRHEAPLGADCRQHHRRRVARIAPLPVHAREGPQARARDSRGWPRSLGDSSHACVLHAVGAGRIRHLVARRPGVCHRALGGRSPDFSIGRSSDSGMTSTLDAAGCGAPPVTTRSRSAFTSCSSTGGRGTHPRRHARWWTTPSVPSGWRSLWPGIIPRIEFPAGSSSASGSGTYRRSCTRPRDSFILRIDSPVSSSPWTKGQD